jgi:hypothetical protein
MLRVFAVVSREISPFPAIVPLPTNRGRSAAGSPRRGTSSSPSASVGIARNGSLAVTTISAKLDKIGFWRSAIENRGAMPSTIATAGMRFLSAVASFVRSTSWPASVSARRSLGAAIVTSTVSDSPGASVPESGRASNHGSSTTARPALRNPAFGIGSAQSTVR